MYVAVYAYFCANTRILNTSITKSVNDLHKETEWTLSNLVDGKKLEGAAEISEDCENSVRHGEDGQSSGEEDEEPNEI